MPSDVFHSPAWLSVLADTYDWIPAAHVLLDDEAIQKRNTVLQHWRHVWKPDGDAAVL